jgi:hypothetical protein
MRPDLGSVETESYTAAHEGARVPDLIAEVGRGDKEGVRPWILGLDRGLTGTSFVPLGRADESLGICELPYACRILDIAARNH